MKQTKSVTALETGLLLALSPLVLSAAEDNPLQLENARLSISIDRRTSGLTEVFNKLSGETYRIDDPGFLVEVGKGKEAGSLGRLAPGICENKGSFVRKNEAGVVFAKGPVTITVSYRLDPQDDFAVKRVRVDYAGDGPFNVSRVEMFDLGVNPSPAEAIPYYGFLHTFGPEIIEDNGQKAKGENSTAFFMRYPEGGMFTALSCDFALMAQDEGTGRCRTLYWPGMVMEAGEPFESEKGLIGIYRRRGYFHQPYSRTEDLALFFFPDVDLRLDRAEIDAVRTAVQKFLKPERFTFLANGWAMGISDTITTAEAGEQFKGAIESAKKFPQIEGLHFIDNLCGLSEEFADHGFEAGPERNPFVHEALTYAKEEGMGISTFLWTSRGQPAPDQPELLVLDADGERVRSSLALTGKYTDFVFDTFSTAGAKYPHIMGLSCDFLYLRADYDADHGYLPGIGSLYAQWANLRNTFRRLRQRFPDWMLRTQMGWAHLSPWFSEHASFAHNSRDPNIHWQRNFLDFHASYQYANNLRLACWYTANNKMFPRYIMNSFIVHKNTDYKAWDYGAWRYCVLSRISAGCGFGMINGTPGFEGGEVFPDDQAAFLDKWINWQRDHKEYYSLAASLYGEPRPTGVDGTAYGNGRDSIVFLCNPTFETQQVSVPINGDIHLPENQRYTVKELYPEDRYRIGFDEGAFAYDSQFVVEVPPQTIAVFEVKPLQENRSYLLGIAGEVEEMGGDLAIRGVSGPAGRTRQFAVRLPESSAAVPEITIDGRPFPMKREGPVLLGQIRFAGEAMNPELSDWTFRKKGGKTILSTEFFVPESARGVLEKQAFPVNEKYRDQEDILNTTGWLDWSRFIIHLPVLPENVNPDGAPFRTRPRESRKREELIAGFTPAALLNGQPATVHSNIMRALESAGAERWSGFFLDASRSIGYGKANTLELEFPEGIELGHFAAFLPNLTPQMTREWEPVDPPEELLTEARPGAARAYPPVPVVRESEGAVTLFMKLSIAGKGAAGFSSDQIVVEEGRLGDVTLLDPKAHPAGGEGTAIQLPDGRARACARFQIDGSRQTRVRLLSHDSGHPEELATVRLGDVLDAWRDRGDRFAPLALVLPGPDAENTVTIELVGRSSENIAVRDTW